MICSMRDSISLDVHAMAANCLVPNPCATMPSSSFGSDSNADGRCELLPILAVIGKRLLECADVRVDF